MPAARAPRPNLPNVTRLTQNSSRFGLRGTESLGGGLNAIWQIESSVSGDAGGGTIAGRDTFLGFQGCWGTVRFGNFLAPYDDLHPIFGNGPSYLTSILATAALWANNGGNSVGGGAFDDRIGNSLRYDTADDRGLQRLVQIGLYDDAAAAAHATRGSCRRRASTRTARSQAGLGYDSTTYVSRTTGLTRRQCGARIPEATTGPRHGAWDFGILRLVGLYERMSYDVPNAGSISRNLWGIGASTARPARGTWQVMCQQADDGGGPSNYRVGGFTGGDNTGAYHLTMSYNYPLRSGRRVRRLLAHRQREQRVVQLQHQPVPHGQSAGAHRSRRQSINGPIGATTTASCSA